MLIHLTVKDEIAQIVSNMVSTFKTSKRAQLWDTFTDEVRNALIDACVMDQVRNAAIWSETRTWSGEGPAFTMRDLMDIRRAFIRALHEGIPRRGNSPLRYVLEANEKEGPP